MIDAVFFLWNRALFDYTKTATTWLRTRRQRRRYAITSLVLFLLLGPLFVIGAYTLLTSLMSL